MGGQADGLACADSGAMTNIQGFHIHIFGRRGMVQQGVGGDNDATIKHDMCVCKKDSRLNNFMH